MWNRKMQNKYTFERSEQYVQYSTVYYIMYIPLQINVGIINMAGQYRVDSVESD